MASSKAPSASTLLALLKEKGFDPDEINQACRRSDWSPFWTPMNYFCAAGNLQMCRYLYFRGADCRQRDRYGFYPMLWAARCGHLHVIKWLDHDAGAHEDIRSVDTHGESPLFSALNGGRFDFDIVQYLILKKALSSPRDDDDDVDGGGIDDMVMRRDLLQGTYDNWQDDRRLTVLSWARGVITTHDTVKLLLLTGTIVPTSLYRRHPNNPYATRSNKRRKKSSSPLVMLKGKAGILELIAHFVAGTPQQLRPLRQLNVLLPAFIEDTPFETILQHTRT